MARHNRIRIEVRKEKLERIIARVINSLCNSVLKEEICSSYFGLEGRRTRQHSAGRVVRGERRMIRCSESEGKVLCQQDYVCKGDNKTKRATSARPGPNHTVLVTAARLRIEMNLNSLVRAAARDGGRSAVAHRA